MRIPRFLAAVSFTLFVLCAASFADYDFSTLPAGKMTWSFTSGPNTVTVSGFDLSGDPAADTVLTYKNDSSTEQGLGLGNDKSGQNEISGSSFIELSGNIASLIFNSVQSGETWTVYQSSSSGKGDLGSLFATGSGPSLPLGGATGFFSVFATGANSDGTPSNILVEATAPSPAVPEPGTTAMITTLGLVGLFEVGRRKLMA